MQLKAEQTIERIFAAYEENPEILPKEVQLRASDADLHRVICDYLAGMTDRYALLEYNKLFDPQMRP
jgi:dGTPase